MVGWWNSCRNPVICASWIVWALTLSIVHTASRAEQAGTLWTDEVCKRPDESPGCLLKTFWGCRAYAPTCRYAGIDLPAEVSELPDPNFIETLTHPWERSWDEVLDVLGGYGLEGQVGPRVVSDQRFKGASRTSGRGPVFEVAYYGYSPKTYWWARSVFMTRRADGTWRVVGFAEWEEASTPTVCDMRTADEMPLCRYRVQGIALPWRNLSTRPWTE